MEKLSAEILAAAFTPMYPDGTVNYSKVPALYTHAWATQVNGIFLNGTTGECMSLSRAERMRLVETWMQEKQVRSEKLKIVAHVGSASLVEAGELAAHAQSLGVDGIAMVPTFYFRPKDLNDLVNQCVYVASASSSTPFYFYNIPSLTGVNFPLIRFLEIASKRIPNFAGIKNSFNDLVDYQYCLHYAKDNYALYWGTDEVFTMVYAAGNRHFVGSTYNYMNSLYLKLIEAFSEGDMNAMLKLQADADSIYQVILAYNNIISGKEVMKYLGVDCGPVRIPLNKLSLADSEVLLGKLKATPLFEYAPKNVNDIAL